ncbi:acyl-CoA dehydrogenase family protein [Streptomyces netropsis]|uniref:Alkylation response protein AidB-like acyl-CoA dehydrogenase n=1 Tax=Streptomyces netropsis TaxID=55404 RepID=A0A7W7LB38_STRNE|nr:acyl-CoA dehydrogenase family protein [Streptomyces netropsis]MBB4886917.1 alkylation response protein AidB-like acyl-CoA dehydrogenase [Streptomyces netropsis]GGR24154.1 acyl-CoA dehydrogenase [Streptomyces netropsis]
MDASLSEEQHQIRRTLRELLLKHCGPDDVKAAVRTEIGYDRSLWRRLAEQLGLPGLAVERRYGGVGCGPTDLALASEETGRALLPSPLLATAGLAAPLVAALGTPRQRAELLPRLAAGELTAALAVPGCTLPAALGLTGPNDGAWSGGGRAGGVQGRPVEGGRSWRLYGEARQVLDGHCAGLLLVAAHAGGYARSRTLLFAVRPQEARGVVRTRQTALDETRPQARIELRDTEAELLGADPDSAPALADDVCGALTAVGERVAAVVAAEAVGAAERALERTVEYARVREQFGRPIGSFQAVKHRLADLYVAVQAARSAAYYAAWAVGRDPDAEAAPGRGEGLRPQVSAAAVPPPGHESARVAAGLALAQALETARIVAGEAVQLHGGIGVTWEHDVQLHFKRAASDELLFGPVHRLRERAAEAAGLFGAGTGREAVAL